jgi:ATP-dependent DNA helicase RecG
MSDVALLEALLNQPAECEWLEFKHNKADSQEIGEYISALSNSATLLRQRSAYIVWGIEDGTHQLLGTTFDPQSAKEGNEPLESWLSRILTPRLDFKFSNLAMGLRKVVILEIPAARQMPTRFSGTEYVRVGSAKKSLKDYPEKERALWELFKQTPFELDVALADIDAQRVLDVLDYPSYFSLTEQPLPEGRSGILDKLVVERFIQLRTNQRYDVTNLGALLFARDLADFGKLTRKALRIIFYKGNSRIDAEREQTGARGYAVGYAGAVKYLLDRLPSNELIEQALRKDVAMYPELALRELVANALIHQDFSIGGSGPLVEVFSDRIEVSNPGVPLNDLQRLMDLPPRSRNEALAAVMRRLRICEERGSGIDRVIHEIERYQLPPPDFRIGGDNTIAVLFAPMKLTTMNPADRIRACYQHACLMYVSNQRMNNSSLRKRFGLDASNAASTSRYFAEALKAKVIRIGNPESKSTKDRWYLPGWA